MKRSGPDSAPSLLSRSEYAKRSKKPADKAGRRSPGVENGRITREQRLLWQLHQMFLLSGSTFHFETFCRSDMTLSHFSGDLQPIAIMIQEFRPRTNLH